MAVRSSWSRNPRIRLTVMFLVVLLPPAVTLIWLGFKLLEQDRILEARQEFERREAAADAAAQFLEQRLSEAENWAPSDPLPAGALGLILTSDSLKSYPDGQILWLDHPPTLPETPTQPFETAEKSEAQGAPEVALAQYRQSERSPDPSVRAGALVRVARVERNHQRIEEAIQTYRTLSQIPGVVYYGTPVDLIARRSICDLLQESSRHGELLSEAERLEKDFLSGRWILDRPTWQLTREDIERWTGRPLSLPEREAVSNGADWIWKMSQEGNLAASGRRGLSLDTMPVTLVWQARASQIKAVVIGPTLLRSWAEESSKSVARLSLLTDSGELLVGEAPDSSARIVSRPLSSTGLPWTLAFSATDSASETTDSASRRRLLSWGLAAIILLLAGSSYVLWRVIARELAVARLQADFVAAVSHEFRTPLTSLRHVTELLEEDDGLPASPEQERRKAFYGALGRNTKRLHRLVESLLDFSRMETGKKPWRLEPLDAGALAADVASAFQKEVEDRGVQIHLQVDGEGDLRLRADAAALTHALWNLLDNAVKYSPEPRPVHVSVSRHPRGIAISIRDEGLGIPLRERLDIFRKFVRGQKAGELGIKGTGLGLAMVSHIVEAHGGAVELESEEGKGSTFRLVLPALA